jgi:hypothetical protein
MRFNVPAGHGIGPSFTLAKVSVTLPPMPMVPPSTATYRLPEVSFACAPAGITTPALPLHTHATVVGAPGERVRK